MHHWTSFILQKDAISWHPSSMCEAQQGLRDVGSKLMLVLHRCTPPQFQLSGTTRHPIYICSTSLSSDNQKSGQSTRVFNFRNHSHKTDWLWFKIQSNQMWVKHTSFRNWCIATFATFFPTRCGSSAQVWRVTLLALKYGMTAVDTINSWHVGMLMLTVNVNC